MDNQQTSNIYTCPMHPEIIQEKPGNCPKCGMNLVPVKAEISSSASHQHEDNNSNQPTVYESSRHSKMEKADLNKTSQSFQRYTCPMHPQIVQDEPGKCPLCGMTLVPLTKSKEGAANSSHSSRIVLVNSNPKDIVSLILFGKATYRKMIQNLIWATGYNVVALPLAAGVLYK